MNNVIHVDFRKQNTNTDSLEDYLQTLRINGIDEDDVLDTKEAIENYHMYETADQDIQLFADGWFQRFAS